MNLDARYLDKIEKIDFKPIFIEGLHRSGTTVLYQMLTASGCFNSVTAYHLIKYDQLLDDYENNRQDNEKKMLTESFRKKGEEDRGIDKLKITADFPEEYGFFLEKKSSKVTITKKNLSKFNEMCKKITYVSDRNKPILLKNPYDFPNFTYIKKACPDAKFIFIHRHPFKVLSSTMNAFRVLYNDFSYYISQLSRIYNREYENPLVIYFLRSLTSYLSFFGLMMITYYSSKSGKYYLKNLKNLPNGCYISITYEALCKSPQQTMENIFSTLNINPTKKVDYKSYIKPRKTTLDPSVIFLKKYIYSSMQTYCKELGYTLENYI